VDPEPEPRFAATLPRRSAAMAAFLGIDAGGTRSTWALLDAAGALLASGAGPAVQPSTQGVGAAGQRLAELCAAALAQAPGVARAVAGVAGAGAPEVRAALRAAVRGALPLAVTGDVEVAAACALEDGPGLVVWAGTGSFAVARDARGALRRIGGRGALLGDGGSAHAIVRDAAVAVVRAADGLAPATALTAFLVDALHAPAPEQLGAHLRERTPGEIAALFPRVGEIAGAGDAVAQRVLTDGARELAELAAALAGRAGLERATCAVALGGGALEAGWYAQRVVAELRTRGFPPPRRPARPPAEGAALLARAVHEGARPLCAWVTGDGAA
jgi:N-acetylglucosamine kinase-like BadF-type ATPase